MALTAINPSGMSWPGVSQAVLGRGGILVSTGHVGADAAGEPVTSSVEDQIVSLFENMKATLSAAGLGFQHVMRLTSYVSSFDPEFMATFRSVRARYFDLECPPASVMVQAGLYDPRLLVETEFVAIVPEAHP